MPKNRDYALYIGKGLESALKNYLWAYDVFNRRAKGEQVNPKDLALAHKYYAEAEEVYSGKIPEEQAKAYKLEQEGTQEPVKSMTETLKYSTETPYGTSIVMSEAIKRPERLKYEKELNKYGGKHMFAEKIREGMQEAPDYATSEEVDEEEYRKKLLGEVKKEKSGAIVKPPEIKRYMTPPSADFEKTKMDMTPEMYSAESAMPLPEIKKEGFEADRAAKYAQAKDLERIKASAKIGAASVPKVTSDGADLKYLLGQADKMTKEIAEMRDELQSLYKFDAAENVLTPETKATKDKRINELNTGIKQREEALQRIYKYLFDVYGIEYNSGVGNKVVYKKSDVESVANMYGVDYENAKKIIQDTAKEKGAVVEFEE